MSTKAATPRLVGVDMLRGFAALWVVLYHALAAYIIGDPDSTLSHALASPILLGYTGVHLFLVLSGFCIHLPMAMRMRDDEPMRLNQKTYWKRRFWRLYPAYAAAMVFSIAFGFASAMWIANDYSVAFAADRIAAIKWDVLSHVTLTHLFSIEYAWSLNNPVFWSLALEAQLYLLYPLLLVMRNRMSLLRVLGCVLLVVLAWRAMGTWVWSEMDFGNVRPKQAQMFVRLHAPARWFEWTLGFALAEVYARGVHLPAWCRSWKLAVAVFVAGAAVEYTDLGRWIVDPLWGVSYALLLGAVINRESGSKIALPTWWKPLAFVGVISYSLYLIHAPLLRGVQLLTYNFAVPTLPAIGIYLLACGGCVPAAYGFYCLFERPFLRSARPKQKIFSLPQPNLKRRAA